jgi:hypothetical protein
MKPLQKTLTIAMLAALAGCSFYHMQTPETVAPGHFSAGVGSIYGTNFFSYPFAGAWVRTGLTPRMDIGISTMLLGAKADLKYRLCDWCAIGTGLGGGCWFSKYLHTPKGIFVGEGSLYLAYPGKIVEPYSVLRFTADLGMITSVGFDTLPRPQFTFIPTGSGVLGLRIRLLKQLSVFAEAGAMVIPRDYSRIGGLGLSIGN